MDSVEIVAAPEHLAHARGRPAFDLTTQVLTDQPDQSQVVVRVVGLGHFEPAGDRVNAGHGCLADGRAHVVEAGFRQRPKILGVIEPDPPNHHVHRFGEARQHETGVAPRCIPGDPACLQHRHRPAAPRQFPRRGQTCKARPDDTDIHVDIGRERPALGRRHHRVGIPARGVGRPLGRVHDLFLSFRQLRPPPCHAKSGNRFSVRSCVT